MTTPAVNRNLNIIGKYTRHTYYQGVATVPPPDLVDFPANWSMKDGENRPVSGNGGKLRGFRLCRAWNHSSYRWLNGDAYELYKQVIGPGKFSFTSYKGNIWSGSMPSPVMPSSNMQNESLIKAYEKLKAQNIHLGNFLAEAHKTGNMLAGAALAIAGQVHKWRRSNPIALWEKIKALEGAGFPRHRWCEIPRSWLQLQYGWKPLMSDIYGSIQHLQKRGRFDVPFIEVKATASDVTTTSSDFTSQLGVVKSLMFTHERKVTTYLVYGLSSARLAEVSSLGLVDPAEIIWELTPYSFVVDWLVPIGSWLSSLTADAGYQFITGGQGSKTTCKTAGNTLKSAGPQAANMVTWPELHVSGSATSYVRTCFSSAPVPGLYVKNPFSWTHVANALALLTQAFRR